MFFVAIHLGKSHGMMEHWNVEILGKKRKKIYYRKMMPDRQTFSAFTPENTQLLRENQYN